MSIAKNGDKVKVHYVGTLKDGTEFDNSRTRGEGLEFILGDGKLLKGFNDVVEGLKIGETKKVDLEANEAYGEYVDEAIITVKKAEFPKEMEFVIKGVVQGQDDQGRPIQGQITKIEEEEVELNMNHPLAGEDLAFEIELLEIVTE
jgi:FKBP-type peptidyl-prolyl cis-trans isomerase 2